MEMIYDIVTEAQELNRAQWTDFVVEHQDGNFFQSPEAFDLFALTKNYEPTVVAVYDDARNITGLLLAVTQKELSGMLESFTARTIVWGGPLIEAEEADQETIQDLLLEALVDEVGSESIYIEFRNLFDTDKYAKGFAKQKFEYQEHLNFIVNVQNGEWKPKKVSSSKRRQIRKSRSSGAEIIEPESLDQVRDFYDILEDLYKNVVKKPLPDWSFFKEFYNLSIQDNIGKYFLIQYESRIVGGIMCPILAKKCIYEWYICGLDREFKKVYPSVLATWAPIEYAMDHDIEAFDFLGAGKPDEEYGVREFKARFKGRLVNHGRYLRVNKPVVMAMVQNGLEIRDSFDGVLSRMLS